MAEVRRLRPPSGAAIRTGRPTAGARTSGRIRSAAAGVASRAVLAGWDLVVRTGAIRSGGPHARRFGAFGANSVVCFPVASLLGEDRMAIGSDTVVGPYSTISAGLPGQPPNPWWAAPTLVIGDRCVLGRNITITAHQLIRIGHDVWTGNGVFISDQNHGWTDPDVPIGRQASEPEPVTIGDGAWLGNGSMILPGVDIGAGAVVAAGAVVTAAVPPRSLVAGVPARVVRMLDGHASAAGTGSSVVALSDRHNPTSTAAAPGRGAADAPSAGT